MKKLVILSIVLFMVACATKTEYKTEMTPEAEVHLPEVRDFVIKKLEMTGSFNNILGR